MKPNAYFMLLLCVTFISSLAQYENYSFRRFPGEELMPLSTAYGRALDASAARNWTESIHYLELSLRLHRLLKDSARRCTQLCSRSTEDQPSFSAGSDLRAHWAVVVKASCQRRCRAHFPALQLPSPSREILEDFRRRSPYRYLHLAHVEMKNLQRAVPCAYTFLQRNPEDQEMLQRMEEYKNEYDLNGFLIDYEEQSFEVSFVQGVKLVASGEFSSGVDHLEEALKLYLEEFNLCQSDCEGTCQPSTAADFYTLTAEVYLETLKCKLRCEENLMPNVGGYFVENFVATLYHYLQYAYYKLNDGRRAVPCAYSYFLFKPEDDVMKHNLLYYKAYSQQWGLQPQHFTPRTEAFKLYNQTAAQTQMLRFAEKYMELDYEDLFGSEEAAPLASESPDVEFEGLGDYEESIVSSWRQPKGKGDVGESDI
ncbi:endoplasmic reticulum protein SC65-like [Oryzias latipes]|uniref:Prolyl 3-hydroxylase family member 4 (inactive) n=1 Tax=Oryzias latipes TaxID=8090 RepID=H2MF07_ORYLA|nr:endoplasmic reticulum protein SC65-like [Oryzias latipes]